jgi:hypothetical protein
MRGEEEEALVGPPEYAAAQLETGQPKRLAEKSSKLEVFSPLLRVVHIDIWRAWYALM